MSEERKELTALISKIYKDCDDVSYEYCEDRELRRLVADILFSIESYFSELSNG